MTRLTLCLAVCLLLATGCDHSAISKPLPRTPRIEDLAKAPVDLARRCPKPQEDLPQLPSGRLPTGAVLVRLCSGWQDPWDLPSDTPLIYPPVDALTRDPDRIVKLVDSLEPLPPLDGYCGGMGAPAFDLWIGYPGRRTAVGHWLAGDCQGINFGGTSRGLTGTNGLLRTFVRYLDEQRQQSGARSDRSAPGCSPRMQPGSAYGYNTAPPWTSATYCVRNGRGPWRQARIPAATLRMINQEATTPAPERNGECLLHRVVIIRARTVYGDLAHVVGSSCGFRTYLHGIDLRESDVLWRPSPKLRRALARLPLHLAPHQAPPTPTQPTVTPQ